jgi:hypothetical protein
MASHTVCRVAARWTQVHVPSKEDLHRSRQGTNVSEIDVQYRIELNDETEVNYYRESSGLSDASFECRRMRTIVFLRVDRAAHRTPQATGRAAIQPGNRADKRVNTRAARAGAGERAGKRALAGARRVAGGRALQRARSAEVRIKGPGPTAASSARLPSLRS